AVGHGYVQGRSKDHAVQAALIDALMQTEAADLVEAQVLVPLRNDMAARKSKRAAKAASTKVDFFTMVRGED
ncbi:MAG: alpha-D-ribose 1-methylphosphonate 5-triphosphate synthase subunit PhnG, partial [Paracoccaceae bacterium]